MNEAEYILRLILRARDELSTKLAKVRTELQGLDKDSAKVTKGFDELNKRVTSANTRIGNLTDKVKEARAAFRDFGSEGEKTGQRAEAAGAKIKKAGDEIETTAEKGKRLADNVKVLQDEFSHLERDLDSGKRSRKDAEDGFKRIGEELQKLSRQSNVGSDLMFAINRVADQVKRAQQNISDSRKRAEADAKASDAREAKSYADHRSEMVRLAEDLVRDVNRIEEEGRKNTQQIDEQDAADRLRRTNARIQSELEAERKGSQERERIANEQQKAADRAANDFRKIENEAHAVNDRIDQVHDAYRRFNAEIARGEHDQASAVAGLREFRGAFDDLGRKMGGFSNIGRAFRLEADNIASRMRDLGNDTDNSGNLMERFGGRLSNLGDSARNMGINVAALDNQLRGMALLAVMGTAQQLLTVVVGLGGSLLSVAGSAAMAGAALGGALAAGAAQALPVLGLLAAALIRVKAVMDAVQQAQLVQQQQAQRKAQGDQDDATHANTIANAQDGVRDALEGVTDARRRVADAVRNVGDAERREEEQVNKLREARREGKRELEDLILAEKRAELQAKGAALSQSESQAAFAEAIRSGQSFQQFQRGELDVASSALDFEEATRDRTRQRVDTRRGVAGGVEGLDSVRQARQGVSDARRGVEDAVRSVGDAERAVQRAERSVVRAQRGVLNAQAAAEKGTSDVFAGAEKLNFMLSQMSDAERDLYEQAKIFSDRWREVSGEFTEPIIREFERAMEDINKMLLDPELVGAATDLSKEIAKQMGRVWDELTDDDTIGQFLQIARDAGRDLKPVTDIILNLGHAFLNIAEVAGEEGGPLDRLLDWAVDMSEKIEDLTDDKTALGEFFDVATDHAEAWLDLGGAVVELFAALVTGGAADEGLGIVKDLTSDIEGATDSIKDNAEGTRRFFANSRAVFDQFKRVVIAVGVEIGKSIDPKTVKPFADFLIDIVIPAFGTAVRWLGRITGALMTLLNFPGLGEGAKLVVTFAIMRRFIQGSLGLLGGLVGGIGKMATALGGAERTGNRLWLALSKITGLVPGLNRVTTALERQGRAAGGAGTAAGRADTFLAGGGGAPQRGGRLGRVLARPGVGLGASLVAGTALAVGGSAAGKAIGGPAGSAVSGAAQGAALGLMFGPEGALIGAGLGGAVGLFTGAQASAEEKKRKAVRDLSKELDGLTKKRDTAGVSELAAKAKSLADEARRFGDEDLAKEFEAVENRAGKVKIALDKWLNVQQALRGSNNRINADAIIDPQAVAEFGDNLQRMRKMSFDSIGEIRDNMQFNVGKINEGLKVGSRSWANSMVTNFGAGIDAVKKAMRDGTISTDAGMKEIRRITRTQMAFARDNMKNLSQDGRDALAENFRSARIAITEQAGGWVHATSKALSEIRHLMAAEFEAYGMDPEQAMRLARNRTSRDPKRRDIDQFGHDSGAGGGQATGGWLGKRGQRGWDSMKHAVGGVAAAAGEAVLNFGHIPVVNDALVNTFGFNLDQMFDRTRAYHRGGPGQDGYAGGFAGKSPSGNKTVAIPGFPGEFIAQKVVDEAVAWARRYKMFITDAFATSGHTGRGHLFFGTAADYVPGPGGSWDLVNKAVGDASKRGITVLYDGRFGSTKYPNHGEGHHAHFELMPGVISKGGTTDSATTTDAAKASIKKVAVKGPDSPFKAIAQAATDAVRRASNVRMNEVIDSLLGTSQTGAAETDPGGSVKASGGSAAEKVFSYLRGRGFTDAQAAGMAGTMQWESHFNTTIRNPDSGATGLAQWLGGRLSNLKKKANWDSLQTQLDFLWEELHGPEGRAFAAIKKAHSIADAVRAWVDVFERPGPGEQKYAERTNFGRQIFKNFADKYEFGGSVPGAGEFPIIAHGGEHVWTAGEVARAGGHGVMRMLRAMLGGGGQARGRAFQEGGDTTAAAATDTVDLTQLVSSKSERERIRAIAMGVFAQTARLATDWVQVMNEIRRATQATRVLGKSIANRIKGLSDTIFQIRKGGVEEDEKDELEAAQAERTRLMKIRDLRKGGVTRRERARLTALEAPDRSRFVQNIDQFIGTDQTTGLFDRAVTANQRASAAAARGLTFATYGITGVSRAVGGRQLTRQLTDQQVAARQLQNARAEQARLAALEQQTTTRIGQVQARMAALRRGGVGSGEAREYAALQGQLGKLQESFGQIRDANAAALDAIYQAQEAYKQAIKDAAQKVVDDINEAARRQQFDAELIGRQAAVSGSTELSRYANAVKRASQQSQIAQLEQASIGIYNAFGAGSNEYRAVVEQVADLRVQIAESIRADFQSTLQDIDLAYQRQHTAANRASRYGDVVARFGFSGRGAANATAGAAQRLTAAQIEAGILQNERNTAFAMQIAAYNAGYIDIYRELGEKVADLDIAIIENTASQRELTTAYRQTFIDLINQRAQFRGGIQGGLSGILDTLGQITGIPDVSRQRGLLQYQTGTLSAQSTGLREQLRQSFGIDLRSLTGVDFVDAIKKLDFDKIESTMSEPDRQQFEGLINAIIENESATQQNTLQLKQLNDPSNIQGFSSSAWQMFRAAIFTGTGGIIPGLSNIPRFDVGGVMTHDGIAHLRAGERVIPVNGEGGTVINMPITSPTEVADPDYFASRIDWNLRGRGKR